MADRRLRDDIEDAVRKSEKKVSKAKPGATVTRRVTQGPNKGDVVRFKANSASAELPGKLTARKVVRDVGPKRARHPDGTPKKRKR